MSLKDDLFDGDLRDGERFEDYCKRMDRIWENPRKRVLYTIKEIAIIVILIVLIALAIAPRTTSQTGENSECVEETN